MKAPLRLYLSLTSVLILGLALGLLWTLSGLWVNHLHLAIGSVFLGFTLGSVCAAAFKIQLPRSTDE